MNAIKAEETLNECVRECREPCKRRRVQSTLYVSESTVWRRREVLRNQLNSTQLTNATIDETITISLSYPSFVYKRMETTPKITVEGFLSSIGGAMGVWAGMSIITLIETCSLLLRLLASAMAKIRFKAK